MRPEVAIALYLEAAIAVEALVADRIYQLKLPQHVTLPAIRVQNVGERTDYHLRGGSLLSMTRVQIDSYADEFGGGDPNDVAETLAAAVHATIDAQIFSVAGSPGTLDVLAVYRRNRMPVYEADERRIVGIMQDYIVWSRQPIN